MLDPVPDAMAQAPEPVVTTKTVTCDKTFGTAAMYTYAEAEFPGYTKEQLAQKLHSLAEYNPAVFGPSMPPGYAYAQYIPYLKDGAASVNCGSEATPSVLSVTFILVD
jgi:hypothetical protein